MLSIFQDAIVRGCSSTVCPLDEMKKGLEPYMIDDKTFWEVCASDILDKLVHGKVLVLMLLVFNKNCIYLLLVLPANKVLGVYIGITLSVRLNLS